jgi:hypothetical protein
METYNAERGLAMGYKSPVMRPTLAYPTIWKNASFLPQSYAVRTPTRIPILVPDLANTDTQS